MTCDQKKSVSQCISGLVVETVGIWNLGARRTVVHWFIIVDAVYNKRSLKTTMQRAITPYSSKVCALRESQICTVPKSDSEYLSGKQASSTSSREDSRELYEQAV